MSKPQRTEPPMSAEAFMDWYDQQPDGMRYELLNGRIHKMQGERASHARAKGALYIALVNAIKSRNSPCEAFVDSMAVRVDDKSVFEPDVLVQCGSPVPGDVQSVRRGLTPERVRTWTVIPSAFASRAVSRPMPP